jgi:hypothetical protein
MRKALLAVAIAVATAAGAYAAYRPVPPVVAQGAFCPDPPCPPCPDPPCPPAATAKK